MGGRYTVLSRTIKKSAQIIEKRKVKSIPGYPYMSSMTDVSRILNWLVSFESSDH